MISYKATLFKAHKLIRYIILMIWQNIKQKIIRRFGKYRLSNNQNVINQMTLTRHHKYSMELVQNKTFNILVNV